MNTQPIHRNINKYLRQAAQHRKTRTFKSEFTPTMHTQLKFSLVETVLRAVAHHGRVLSCILFPDDVKPQRPIRKDTNVLAVPTAAVCPALRGCISLVPADLKRSLPLGIVKVKNNIVAHSPIYRRHATVS